jgi:formate dehydrogenase alpha subunit
MTNDIKDIQNADAIFLIGSNPTENHPVIGTIIKRAVLSGKTKLIVCDPRDIGISRFAEIKLTQTPGTDVALLNGMMRIIITEELYDKKFIVDRTENFENLKKCVDQYTPDYVQSISGIPSEDLISAARIYANAEAASIIYAMGITQHSSGTDCVKSLASLAMLCGNMGIPGGGVNPLRGQNNVQGACDLGALPNVYTGYQKVADVSVKKKFETAWQTDLSSEPGLTVMEMMNGAENGTIRGMYIIGENPMISDPDLNHTQECLKKLDILVVQDIFLTDTAKLADVVLPSLCFAEKDGTFTNTERRVTRIRKAIDGPGSAREDWKITCDISSRMGYEMYYQSVEEIFDEISAVTPSYQGINYQRIEEDGIHWPCPSIDHPGTPILHVGKFARGLGMFHNIHYTPPAEVVDDEYPLYLTTGRSLYHYHTGTMTMKSDGLNERAPACYIQISSDDAERFNIKQGADIEIMSRRGKITATARVSQTIQNGTIFIPFHFSHAAANRLTNNALDPVSKIPELKVCAVKIRPVSENPYVNKKWGQLDISGNTRKVSDDFCEFLEKEGLSYKREQIDTILKVNRKKHGTIIPVLQQVQNIIGFLPPVVQYYIANGLNIPASEVYGVLTFYAFFTQIPRGKFTVKICMGTACYVTGGNEVTNKFVEKLGIQVGQTTDDRLFTLETVRCIGCCGLAPAIMINDDTYGKVTPAKVEEIIAYYRENRNILV